MWKKIEDELPEENKTVLLYFKRGYYSAGFLFDNVWMFDSRIPMKIKPYAWCNFEEYKE